MKKTIFKYYWHLFFEHAIVCNTVTNHNSRCRYVYSDGTTLDGINKKCNYTGLSSHFWDVDSFNSYPITRAQFRKYMKTGIAPVKRKA